MYYYKLKIYMEAFVDYYDAFGGSIGPDTPTDELQKRYKSLLLNWHPDKRPNSATGEGKRKTCLINAAWDILKSPRKREAYNLEWAKVRDEKMLPFERAEDRRRKGNDLYRDAHALSREGNPFEAAQKYMAAIEMYSDGIKQETGDHRLYSNRGLSYAALQDWTKAKRDAIETTKLRPNFMKGWFTLCRSMLMDNDPHNASRELEKALKLCDRHPDLVRLQEEIRAALGEQKPRGSYLAAPAAQPTLNVSPACTPPTPRLFSNASRMQPQWGMDLEQTAQFGRTNINSSGLHETANFGLRRNSATTPPRIRVNPPNAGLSQSMSSGNLASGRGATYTPPASGGQSYRTPRQASESGFRTPSQGPFSPASDNSAGPGFSPAGSGSPPRTTQPSGQRMPTAPRSFGPSLAQLARTSAPKEASKNT